LTIPFQAQKMCPLMRFQTLFEARWIFAILLLEFALELGA